METQGHLISDTQFDEYQRLIKSKKYLGSLNVEVHSVFNGGFMAIDRFHIIADSNGDLNTDEFYKAIERNFNGIQDGIKKSNEELELKKKEVDELMESTTIWHFLKNRKKLKAQ